MARPSLRLIGRNMTVRRALGPIPAEHLELVDLAEACGTTATFAGSGGAVVGPFDDEAQFETLCDAYADVGADAIRIENESIEVAEEPTSEGASDKRRIARAGAADSRLTGTAIGAGTP